MRSSGPEDTETFTNAGAFRSLVCRVPSELYVTVAGSALSAFHYRSRKQAELLPYMWVIAPIPVFIQKLVDPPITAPQNPGFLPLLSQDALTELRKKIQATHYQLNLRSVDLEWAIESDYGLVSATSLTRTYGESLIGEMAFGFGFASAQSEVEANCEIYWIESTEQPLIGGKYLVEVNPTAIYLVQARPAPGYDPMSSVKKLTAESLQRLVSQGFTSYEVEFIVRTDVPASGSFLIAKSVQQAWDLFIALPIDDRRQLVSAIVQVGSPNEHAALMFRELNIAVLKFTQDQAPLAGSIAVVDSNANRWLLGNEDHVDLDAESIVSRRLPSGLAFVRTASLPTPNLTSANEVGSLIKAGMEEVMSILSEAPSIESSISKAIALNTAIGNGSWVRNSRCSRPLGMLGSILDAATFKVRDKDYPVGISDESLAKLIWSSYSVDYTQPNATTVSALAWETLHENENKQVAFLLIELAEQCPVIPDSTSQCLSEFLTTTLTNHGPDSCVGALVWLVRVVVSMTQIDVYSGNEVADKLQRSCEALGLLDKSQLEYALINADSFLNRCPPLEAIRMLELTATDSSLFEALERLDVATRKFDLSMLPVQTLTAGMEIVSTSELIHDLAQGTPVVTLINSDLVEVFDQKLKATLAAIVSSNNSSLHVLYLKLTDIWLRWCNVWCNTEEKSAIRNFLKWCELKQESPAFDNYLIDDCLSWRRVWKEALRSVPSFANTHYMHNVLHQWCLRRFSLESSHPSPQFIQDLISFGDQFCESPNTLLRFSGSLIEIGVPYCIHKASFLIEPTKITAEWSEPPDVEANLLGRLVVFENLIKEIDFSFPQLRFYSSVENESGSWVFLVEVKRKNGALLSKDEIKQVYIYLRTMYDSAYSFSYVSADELVGLSKIAGSTWRWVMDQLVSYRQSFSMEGQYKDLRSFAFGTFLSKAHMSLWGADLIETCTKDTFEQLALRLEGQTSLGDESDSASQWARYQDSAGLVALFMSMKYEKNSLETLLDTSCPLSLASQRILAKNLLGLASCQNRVSLLKKTWNPRRHWSQFDQLVMEFCPSALITEQNANAITELVLLDAESHRRAKQLLLHRFAIQLSGKAIEDLCQQLFWIPFGSDGKVEHRIHHSLRNRSDDSYARFDITAQPQPSDLPGEPQLHLNYAEIQRLKYSTSILHCVMATVEELVDVTELNNLEHSPDTLIVHGADAALSLIYLEDIVTTHPLTRRFLQRARFG